MTGPHRRTLLALATALLVALAPGLAAVYGGTGGRRHLLRGGGDFLDRRGHIVHLAGHRLELLALDLGAL